MKEKEFLLYIIKALVDEPDEVEINVVEGEKSTIFELKVASSDIGKVIGKSGRIAKAIRTILNAAIARSGKRISLDILG
ncbi:MAG: KH domain-containing protein [Spirochaetota bacterium]|nr:MAG: KH domain-containing protein [Spirochaetota bacterium]